jgi:predicted nucleotidyltransferase
MGIITDIRLASFLFGRTRRAAMSLFFEHPDEAYYVSQIVRLLDKGSGAVQRELRLMAEAGIIFRTKKGNQAYYQANKNCPAFNEIKKILEVTSAPVPALSGSRLERHIRVPQQELESFCRQHHIGKLAFFGSVLREDFRPDSDVDVLVDFEHGHTPGLFRLIEMETLLAQLLDVGKVDLRTPEELSHRFRKNVVKEAEVRYG